MLIELNLRESSIFRLTGLKDGLTGGCRVTLLTSGKEFVIGVPLSKPLVGRFQR